VLCGSAFYIRLVIDKQIQGLLFEDITKSYIYCSFKAAQCNIVLNKSLKYGQKTNIILQEFIPFLLYYIRRRDEIPELSIVMSKQQADTENYWQNELRSLGIESKRKNQINNNEELQALADSIKQVYYQDYKTAYGEEHDEKVKASDFGYII